MVVVVVGAGERGSMDSPEKEPLAIQALWGGGGCCSSDVEVVEEEMGAAAARASEEGDPFDATDEREDLLSDEADEREKVSKSAEGREVVVEERVPGKVAFEGAIPTPR